LTQGLVLLPLLALQASDSLWIVYIVTFIQSTFAIFFSPAENALLPRLVAEEDLLAANWLNALNDNLARLIGPPIGGAILALKGLSSVVIFDSVSFLVAAFMILAIQAPARTLRGREEIAENDGSSSWSRFWQEWREGIAYIRRSRVVTVLFICTVFLSFGGVMMDPLSAPFILDVVKAGAEIFGILAAVQAIGGLVGSVVASRFVTKLSPALIFGWSEIVLGLVLFVRYNIPTLPVVFAMTMLTGLPASLGMGALNTLFQQNVPDSHLGRISGALNATIGLLSIFGVLGIAGLLGQTLGVVPVLNIATSITLLEGVGALLFLPIAKGVAPQSNAEGA
jgi:predicted MFS family arabinose efflux permease